MTGAQLNPITNPRPISTSPAEHCGGRGLLRRARGRFTALREFDSGEFCYALTARQMGKSSLMVRAAARLREERGRGRARPDGDGAKHHRRAVVLRPARTDRATTGA